jgi:hypothetical protein
MIADLLEPPPNEAWPDHYHVTKSKEQKITANSLLAQLGLDTPIVKVNRRI